MKLPDLPSTLEEASLTLKTLAEHLSISEYKAHELIQNEASGEITVAELREVYAALGMDILILPVHQMPLETQEEIRETAWRDLDLARDWSAPPRAPELQLQLLRQSFVVARLRYNPTAQA